MKINERTAIRYTMGIILAIFVIVIVALEIWLFLWIYTEVLVAAFGAPVLSYWQMAGIIFVIDLVLLKFTQT